MSKKCFMEVISPEPWVNGGLKEGENEGCQCPLFYVKEAKAPFQYSPVERLLLGLLEHVSIYEGLSLAGEVFHVLHPGVNNITSVVKFAICKTVDTVSSQVHWHKSTTFPGSDSVSHPLF